MNINRRVYFYNGKLPLSFLPLVFFGIITFAVLVILGLFVGVILGVVMIGLLLLRLLISGKKKTNQVKVEETDRTITLTEGEYRIVEKKKS